MEQNRTEVQQQKRNGFRIKKQLRPQDVVRMCCNDVGNAKTIKDEEKSRCLLDSVGGCISKRRKKQKNRIPMPQQQQR